ncbi:hypothetical protein DFH06DRAFT_914458, partial [Mycena polygramma]
RHHGRSNCACNSCKDTRTECRDCPNPNKCHLKARQLLRSLEPKWNPLLLQPEDYEDEAHPPIELGEKEVLFNPKITTRGTLGDAFRIFTDG